MFSKLETTKNLFGGLLNHYLGFQRHHFRFSLNFFLLLEVAGPMPVPGRGRGRNRSFWRDKSGVFVIQFRLEPFHNRRDLTRKEIEFYEQIEI